MAGRFFEVLDALETPEAVFRGSARELVAARQIDAGKYLVVAYKEQDRGDGFVITAFLTRRFRQLARREKIWPR
jgi:hypothetical protein